MTTRCRINERLHGRVVRHGSRRFRDEVVEDGVKVGGKFVTPRINVDGGIKGMNVY